MCVKFSEGLSSASVLQGGELLALYAFAFPPKSIYLHSRLLTPVVTRRGHRKETSRLTTPLWRADTANSSALSLLRHPSVKSVSSFHSNPGKGLILSGLQRPLRGAGATETGIFPRLQIKHARESDFRLLIPTVLKGAVRKFNPN
jgi:hypothetical protein